jgi:levansucrase
LFAIFGFRIFKNFKFIFGIVLVSIRNPFGDIGIRMSGIGGVVRRRNLKVLPDSLNLKQQNGTPWSKEQAAKVLNIDPRTIIPISKAGTVLATHLNTWDFCPMFSPDGRPVEAFGKKVLFYLSTKRDPNLTLEQRDATATYRYATLENGVWKDQGSLFSAVDALGSRQWGGVPRYNPETNELIFFYTATGGKDDRKLTFGQTICMARGKAKVTNGEISFEFSEHEEILKPDGDRYGFSHSLHPVTGLAMQGRDPFIFIYKDKTYMVFSGTLPGASCDGLNACIGLAKAKDKSLSNWEFLDPILFSNGVAAEMEVPHVVIYEDKIYLFFNARGATLNQSLRKHAKRESGKHTLQNPPTALYGFVADSLDDEFRPINSNGIVLCNPLNKGNQNYAFRIFPSEQKDVFKVTSHRAFNLKAYDPFAKCNKWQKVPEFLGRLAPELQVRIDGDNIILIEHPQTTQDWLKRFAGNPLTRS